MDTNIKKSMIGLFDNPLGSGIINVLMAAGVIGVISVGIMKQTELIYKSKKKLDLKETQQNIAYTVTQVLRDPDSCTKTFKGVGNMQSVDSFYRVSFTKQQTGNQLKELQEITKKKTVYGTGSQARLKLVDIRLIAVEDLWVANARSVPAEVVLSFESLSKITSGSKSFSKKIPIKVDLDTSRKVLSCVGSLLLNLESICSSYGGSYLNGKCSNLNIRSDSNNSSIVSGGDLWINGSLLVGEEQGDVEQEDVNVEINSMGESKLNSFNVKKDVVLTLGDFNVGQGNLNVTGDFFSKGTITSKSLALGKNVKMLEDGSVTVNSLNFSGGKASINIDGQITFDDLVVKTCKAGQIAIITGDGIKCLSSATCNSSKSEIKVFDGIDRNGNIICKTIFRSESGCLAGEVILKAKIIFEEDQYTLQMDCCTPDCSESINYKTTQIFQSRNYRDCPFSCIGTATP